MELQSIEVEIQKFIKQTRRIDFKKNLSKILIFEDF